MSSVPSLVAQLVSLLPPHPNQLAHPMSGLDNSTASLGDAQLPPQLEQRLEEERARFHHRSVARPPLAPGAQLCPQGTPCCPSSCSNSHDARTS